MCKNSAVWEVLALLSHFQPKYTQLPAGLCLLFNQLWIHQRHYFFQQGKLRLAIVSKLWLALLDPVGLYCLLKQTRHLLKMNTGSNGNVLK